MATPSLELPGLSQLIRDERSAFDCFNEDLVWIVDKLVQRTGGVAGVISGHLPDEDGQTLLATSTSSGSGHDPQFISQLTMRAAAAPPTRGTQHDTPLITHSLLSLHHAQGDTSRYRILQLSFSPAVRVKIVATVAKESHRGFNLIEDAIAKRLYPVLSRYVRLWWLHRAERRKAQTLSTVIDMSDLGIVLLNRETQLLFANSRARALLDRQDGLQQQGRAVIATSADAVNPLQTALAQALQTNQTARGAPGVGRSTGILQLGRRQDRRELIVAAVPVLTPAVDSDDPAVILYVLDPDQDIEQLLAPVCGIYKLTTVEARLVGHLVAGHRVVEAAALMQIRPQTARAYLKQIFNKTQTHRQADLVRVMLTSAMRTTAPVDFAAP